MLLLSVRKGKCSIANVVLRCCCVAVQEDELVEKERSAADAALRASDARVSVSALTATKDSVAAVVDQLNAMLDGYVLGYLNDSYAIVIIIITIIIICLTSSIFIISCKVRCILISFQIVMSIASASSVSNSAKSSSKHCLHVFFQL